MRGGQPDLEVNIRNKVFFITLKKEDNKSV